VRWAFESSTSAAAAQNQLWTHSVFVRLVAGSLGDATLQVEIREFASGVPSGGLTGTVFTPTSAPLGKQRFAHSRTLTDATVTHAQPTFRVGLTGGSTYDFTLRIGWPQMESWSSSAATTGAASSPIRTTGAAATRAADVVTMPLLSALSAYTLVAIASPYTGDTNTLDQAVAELNDGTSANVLRLRRNTGAFSSRYFIGGVGVTGTPSPNAWPIGTRAALASAVASNDNAAAFQGGTAVAASPAPSGLATVSTLRVGTNSVSSAPFYGYIERIDVYGIRADNTNLQRLSQLVTYGG
jgi:hypothetical protein